jgi:hypothetical protein
MALLRQYFITVITNRAEFGVAHPENSFRSAFRWIVRFACNDEASQFPR